MSREESWQNKKKTGKPMKRKTIKYIVSVVTAIAAVVPMAYSQTSTVMAGLQGIFDVNNTNSLIHANEVSLTPLMKWNAKSEELGGGLKLDWWISDQQGVALEYDEFASRDAYWQFGYQARTVFKGLEVALGAGTRQAEAVEFGTVQLYLQPSLKWHVYKTSKLDASVMFGADMLANQRPNPFLGASLTFWRF